MKKKENKKFWQSKKAVCLSLMVVAMLSFGGTWAYYSDILTAVNPFNTSHSGAAIVEEYNPDSSFLPGETVAKEVAFTNTGDMDIFLRVEVPPTESWYDPETKETLTETEGYVTDAVIKNWTDYWKENSDSSEWSEEIDGYRYYLYILKAGETTNDILDSIALSTEVSNDRHDVDYSKKIYRLTFDAEAIPVEAQGEDNDIAQSEWPVTVTIDDSNGKLTWSFLQTGE